MIFINNIHKSFSSGIGARRSKVLNGVNFTIREGSITGFLGSNGSGKTTTIRMIMGFLSIEQGEILFDNILGGNIKRARSQIGFMPEDSMFYQQLTGQEFLEYMGRLANLPHIDVKNQISQWSKRLSISDALPRVIRGYSKGMKQRLSMVNALLHDPRLLILDEPLSGLDPSGRLEMRDIMLELKSLGKTIFFSSHIISDVEQVCDNVIILAEGKVLFDSPMSELLKSATEATTYQITPFYGDRDKRNLMIEVDSMTKDSKIAEIIREGGNIERVQPKTISLEEAVYRIQSNS
jgi:ABC-2 type transport system ATP-binding protein